MTANKRHSAFRTGQTERDSHNGIARMHRVIMYYIKTKAKYCHPHIGQFLGSQQTLGGGEGSYFCRFYLAVFDEVLIARNTFNKYRTVPNLLF
jgi:hypothetical protein